MRPKTNSPSPAQRSIRAGARKANSYQLDEEDFADLATNPVLSTKDFKAVPAKYRALLPDYIKDYVSLNQFAT